jgi:lauroyl/myristoyl acyltransferase
LTLAYPIHKTLSLYVSFPLNVKPVNILSGTGRVEDDVALMNQAIEQLVKTKPEQYLWNYKRFKGIICYYDSLMNPLLKALIQLGGSGSMSRSQAPAWECI